MAPSLLPRLPSIMSKKILAVSWFVQCHMKLYHSSCKLTLADLQDHWVERLEASRVPESALSVKHITDHVVGRNRTANLMGSYYPSLEETEKIGDLCRQRLQRIPVQYVIGEWDFRYLNLTMQPPVFIPRPETEELVDLVTAGQRLYSCEKFVFLEVGCGTGAVSLALLSEYPSKATCVAVDKSQEAVNLTQHNAQRIGVEKQMLLQCIDVGSILHMDHPSLYDAIISNPPYIPQREMALLQPEIQRYEDAGALCGGTDGLDVVRTILECARSLLKPHGSLWLEVDVTHPPLIKALVRQRPELGLRYIRTHKDFSNRPRFCHVQRANFSV